MSRLRMVMDQGDPGLFDIVRRAGGAAIRTFVPGGGTALSLTSALARRGGGTGALGPAMRLPPIQGAGLPVRIPTSTSQLSAPFRFGQALGTRLAGTGGVRNIPAGSFRRAGLIGAAPRRRRRMNPTNFRALQRGLRRLKAFSKLAKMVLKSEARFKAPKKRGVFGRRRKR